MPWRQFSRLKELINIYLLQKNLTTGEKNRQRMFYMLYASQGNVLMTCKPLSRHQWIHTEENLSDCTHYWKSLETCVTFTEYQIIRNCEKARGEAAKLDARTRKKRDIIKAPNLLMFRQLSFFLQFCLLISSFSLKFSSLLNSWRKGDWDRKDFSHFATPTFFLFPPFC